jgi:hypothetical protein
MIIGVEDEPAAQVAALLPGRVTVEPRRNQYDYIYLRRELAELKGGSLKAKRNHVNKFLSMYPDFCYRPLEPSLFDECRRLAKLWRSEVDENGHDTGYDSSADAEARAMENVFSHWEQLDALGGSIFIDGRMGLYCLVALSACMSLMFPTIYGIALQGLGDDAKFGAAGLIMAILGGSVLPPLQANIIDQHTLFGMPAVNVSFFLPLVCFLVIIVYGYRTYTRTK